ncbi:hypothetical protein CCACVL1_06081 [Corchorus capsularis]|uniref:Uncharacterized protein n=1 Tax=Corchorus capsularis TaxID=210143 RepID=A0A1R3JHH4_COCAP|nr:hypothetical protein CCACVL1_06081 [Corchorus capsularis]
MDGGPGSKMYEGRTNKFYTVCTPHV